MTFYEELAAKSLGTMLLQTLKDSSPDLSSLVHDESVIALGKIHAALNDDSLSDFMCLDEIIHVFDTLGLTVHRHDF